MAKWSFSMATLEKGRVTVMVSAANKPDAIQKGHDKIKKKGLSCTPHWDCRLVKA